LATISCGLLIAAGKPKMQEPVAGNGAMIFALLVAWDRFHGCERLILLGIGEISVRQAVILVALVDVLISWFGLGWFLTLAMMSGGLVGWLYLFLCGKHALNQRSQVVDSERIARLEL
jgi:hypothetical protein